MKYLLSLLFFALLQFPLLSQCTVVSSDGYTVNISITPKNIVAPSTCPWGYNYNVELDYNITFSGSNIPSGLYTLQGNLTCGSTVHFFDLPNGGGVGTSTSNSNQWNPNSDCNEATPSSLSCNTLQLKIEGPGIAPTKLVCAIANLPIELVYFTASSTSDDQVDLKWLSASELNNDYYEIQRSTDLDAWSVIAQIDGAGNSNEPIAYQVEDASVLAGLKYYYRLKQVDFDGSFSFSDHAVINVDQQKGKLTVFPNPSAGAIYISGAPADAEQVQILDMLGNSVVYQMVNANQNNILQLNLAALPKGTYLVKYRDRVERFQLL